MEILLFIIALALLPYAIIVAMYVFASIIALFVLFFKGIAMLFRFFGFKKFN